MAMHGDVLLDADRIAKTLTAMVATGELDPMTPAEIRAEAATVAHFMQTQGDFYDNPALDAQQEAGSQRAAELLHRRQLPVRQPRPPRNAAAARACC